jgi:hypothetical protein
MTNPQLPPVELLVPDGMGLFGFVMWEMRGPDGKLKSEGIGKNLITAVGDRGYGERGSGMAGALAAPTCMKYGTGTTAAAKTGAGAALGTYVTTSAQVFDGTYPQSGVNGSYWRITYKVSYAAGAGTSATPITEAALCNDFANATSVAANTWARAIISPGAKGALDTLSLTWQHDIAGT